jgi:hypothetical protein
MRKAIEAFEREFAQWGLSLPARDVVERQPGHMDRHGWSLDYSFGADAFGEYLEYHGRRAVPNEPAIERHTRVYHNGERNFIPAPDAEGAPAAEPSAPPAAGESPHRPTLPPFDTMVKEATGESRVPASRAALRDRVAASTQRPPAPAARATSRIAPSAAPRTPFRPAPSSSRGGLRANQRSAMSFAIGVGAALLVAMVLFFTVRTIRARSHPAMAAAPDTAALEPIVVYAPAVLGFTTDGSSSRLTQPLVGGPRDPNRAEIVRPDHGMTPIIPSDPRTTKHAKPAGTTRGEKFHVP